MQAGLLQVQGAIARSIAGPPQHRLQELISDVVQRIFGRLSTAELVNLFETREGFVSGHLCAEVEKAVKFRWMAIARHLHGPAITYFNPQMLTTVCNIAARTYEEWEGPLRTPICQSPSNLSFASRVPFPRPYFLIDPFGRLSPLPPGPGLNWQAGHGYVLGWPSTACLRNCHTVEIVLCFQRQ